jgi:hypothetical protein
MNDFVVRITEEQIRAAASVLGTCLCGKPAQQAIYDRDTNKKTFQCFDCSDAEQRALREKVMKLELRKFKSAEFASEETLCFSADVYVDGVHIGSARNDGQGGSTFVSPLPDAAARAKLDAFFAWARAQPAITTDLRNPDGSNYVMDVNAEYLIDVAAGRLHDGKALKRLLKTKIVVKTGKDFRTWKPRDSKAMSSPLIREQIRKQHPDAVFLNDMPFEDALTLFARS